MHRSRAKAVKRGSWAYGLLLGEYEDTSWSVTSGGPDGCSSPCKRDSRREILFANDEESGCLGCFLFVYMSVSFHVPFALAPVTCCQRVTASQSCQSPDRRQPIPWTDLSAKFCKVLQGSAYKQLCNSRTLVLSPRNTHHNAFR